MSKQSFTHASRLIAACAAFTAVSGAATAAESAVAAASKDFNTFAADTATTRGVHLPSVEVIANRATAKTPVAFTNISKTQLSRENDGRDVPYLLQMTPRWWPPATQAREWATHLCACAAPTAHASM